VIASLIFGVNPLEMIGRARQRRTGSFAANPAAVPPPPGYGPQRSPAPPGVRAPPDAAKDFVRATLGDTEDVWQAVFKTLGAQYQAAGWCSFMARRVPHAAVRQSP
jgi:predicted metalloprotease